jgi:nicotinamide riboside kinase
MSVPRIAVSGSAGTGKTTLGRALAAHLGVPFIAEGMRQRLESGYRLGEMSHDDFLSLARELWDEHLALVRAGQTTGFVSDRCAADFAAYRMTDSLMFHDTAGAEIEAILDQLPLYSSVVVLPWGAMPIAADGVRSQNRWLQLRFQTVVEGLLQRFAPPGQVLAIGGAQSVEARLAEVLRATHQPARRLS